MFATWAILDRTVLTQAPAQTPPAGGTPAPPAPPAGGGRAGDPAPAEGRGGGRGGRGGVLTPFAKEALAVLRAPLDRLTPVTDEMLRNPPPGDWLHWRRTYDGWAYSPLKEINRDTVKNLKVAWTWSLNSTGVNEFTPLVHDGVMFMWNFGETIQALDAKTGTLLWQYSHLLPEDYPSLPAFFRTKRSLAIGGNKLIVPTIDMHVIALDVKTGTKVWDVVTDDYKSLRTYNSGPLVIKDKVLVGAGNCSPGHANSATGTLKGIFPPGGCFITGHDLETGKQLWRFNTIAQADEPGGDTWNNLPNEKRGGGAIWVVGQYDPELNLTYWGTGSPSPWSTVTRGTFDAKGLYMNSTLALNPDTGKLVWYYQHIGADPYDQDYAFERIVVTGELPGETPQGRDHRWQARDFRSRGCRDRPVPVRERSGCAERRHQDRFGDRGQDAAPRTTTRWRDPLPGQHRRQKFPGRLVQSVDQPVLPADYRHLHGENG